MQSIYKKQKQNLASPFNLSLSSFLNKFLILLHFQVSIMENLIKQVSMRIFGVEEEKKAQTSRVVRNRKISSRRTRSSKGDSWKDPSWGRRHSRETGRDCDKTEGDEFRTAVAAAAFIVNSIENKQDEIKQEPTPKPTKTLSEILEVSPKPETNDHLPGGANIPMPTVVTTQADDKVSTKNISPATSIKKSPSFVADKQSAEKTSQKEPESRLREADIWEKIEMEKINQRYVKLKAKVFEWENRKKSKAKNKLTRKEGKLEWKRVRALQDFKEKVGTIEKISNGARSQSEENRKKEEMRVKAKADLIRSTRKIPKPIFLRCC